MGALLENLGTFMIIALRILRRMRTVSGIFVEKIKTQFIFYNIFSPKTVSFIGKCRKVL